jgi:ArsR family transcriptional regulator
MKFNLKTDLSKSFRALSNPIRLKVFMTILEEACECDIDAKGKISGNCVTHIAELLNLPQPTVSNHVKELVNSGLINQKKKGKVIYLFGSKEVVDEMDGFSKFCVKEVSGEKH